MFDVGKERAYTVPTEPCSKAQSEFPIGLNGGTGKVVLHKIIPAPADPPSLASTTANCCASSLNSVFIAALIVNCIPLQEIQGAVCRIPTNNIIRKDLRSWLLN